MLIMAGGAALNLASNAYEAVTGKNSVATRHSKQTASLNKDLAGQKKINRKLQTKVTSLTDDVANYRSSKRMVLHKGRKTTAKAAVLATTAVITKRAAATASRSAGSVVGKAIPYFGTTVIIGVTAWELRDLCNTMKDMNELSRAFDPTLEPSEDQVTVCSMELPLPEEVWETVKASPGQAWTAAKPYVPTLPAWAEVKAYVPTVEDMKAIDMPDIDWDLHWRSFQSGTSSFVDYGKAGIGNIWEMTAEGATEAWATTSEAAKNTAGEFGDYLFTPLEPVIECDPGLPAPNQN